MARKAMALTRTNPYPTDLVRILGGGSCNDAGGWDQSPQKTMTHVRFFGNVSWCYTLIPSPIADLSPNQSQGHCMNISFQVVADL